MHCACSAKRVPAQDPGRVNGARAVKRTVGLADGVPLRLSRFGRFKGTAGTEGFLEGPIMTVQFLIAFISLAVVVLITAGALEQHDRMQP